MAKTVIKRLLVIGDNPDERCSLFSADTQVEPYVKYYFKDREKLRRNQLMTIEGILNSDTIKLTETQKEIYTTLYQDTSEMDAEEFFEHITEGMEVDEKTGDAYSTINPNAKFKYQACYDKRIRETGEESEFSNPFILKDGTKAYSAKKNEIDWPRNHMHNTEIYRAAWELCVDDRDPQNETEVSIKENMKNRIQYFLNFRNVDEYIRHNCCFWTNAVIDGEGKYHELDYKTSDKQWISEFYERFIEALSDDTLLTLYEVRSMND